MLHDYVAPNQRWVACPNQDVVYGAGIAALDATPVVVQVPDFAGRFWVYQVVDLRTDGFAEIGAVLPPMLALIRVGRALDELRRALADAGADEPPAPSTLALLLIDAGFWMRYRFAEDRLVYEPHTVGPDQTDAVVLTSEAALQALLNGRLSLDDAVSSNLVTVASDGLSPGTLKIMREALRPRLRSSNKN
jgi:hypothetical protein